MSALEGALAAVDAALFAYSTITPRLDPAGAAAGALAFAALRAQRDKLRTQVIAGGGEPAVPPPAYDLGPLPDVAAARAVALRTEESLAAAMAALVQATTGAARDAAAAWLTESAVRAVGWRAALGITPTTVPFPGLSAP